MNNSKLPAYLFVAFAGVLLLLAVYKTFLAPKSGVNNTEVDKTGQTVGMPTEAYVPPTLSPQEKEIIAKIETLSVDITDTMVSPAVLTVKRHDQVAFFNKSKVMFTVDGGDWGKVPLQPGENMTQAFKELGTFKYTVAPLGLDGEVVVK